MARQVQGLISQERSCGQRRWLPSAHGSPRGLLHQTSLLPAGARRAAPGCLETRFQEHACLRLRSAALSREAPAEAPHTTAPALKRWEVLSSALRGVWVPGGPDPCSEWMVRLDPGKLVTGVGGFKSLPGSNSSLRPGCCFKSRKHFDLSFQRGPFKCFFYFIGCTLGEWTEYYNRNIELIQIRLLFTL